MAVKIVLLLLLKEVDGAIGDPYSSTIISPSKISGLVNSVVLSLMIYEPVRPEERSSLVYWWM